MRFLAVGFGPSRLHRITRNIDEAGTAALPSLAIVIAGIIPVISSPGAERIRMAEPLWLN